MGVERIPKHAGSVAATAVQTEPLRSFQRLSPQVLYLEAAGKRSASSSGSISNDASYSARDELPGGRDKSPELVILFTWMGAKPKHIAKYTAAYQMLYPQASILLVTNNFIEVVLRPSFNRQRRIAPAIPVALATIEAAKSESRKPRILVNCYSNGGTFTFLVFARLFQRQTGSTLPLSALILDSGPSRGNYHRNVAAIMADAPANPLLRLLTLAAVHAVLTFFWVVGRTLGTESLLQRTFRETNEGKLFSLHVPRLYLYSKADKMVDWRDVELHAEKAKEMGAGPVELCRFEGSDHVNHVREDADRYWNAVRQCWALGNS